MMHAEKPKVVSIRVSSNSCYCGTPLRDILLPEECEMLGLFRENHIILANNNPPIQPNDILLAIAINPMSAPELKVFLNRLKPLSACQISQQ
ncbi:TrkA C-terminal domain-containing protein [Capilliphycus salinus ALCB114379]|uniref:TrkA C-terminal domain-containing protein n=1 Tax=Capilliphycus salinus TaxID=2768948 RepID=UPI0039A5825B